MESVFFGFFQFALFNLPHPLPQGGKGEGNGNQVSDGQKQHQAGQPVRGTQGPQIEQGSTVIS